MELIAYLCFHICKQCTLFAYSWAQSIISEKDNFSKKLWPNFDLILIFWVVYSSRRLYQYNKDDFLLKFWMFNSFFRITSWQVFKEKFF